MCGISAGQISARKKGKHAASLLNQLTPPGLLAAGVDLDQRLVHLRWQRLAFTRYTYRWRCLGRRFLCGTQLLRIGRRQRQTGGTEDFLQVGNRRRRWSRRNWSRSNRCWRWCNDRRWCRQRTGAGCGNWRWRSNYLWRGLNRDRLGNDTLFATDSARQQRLGNDSAPQQPAQPRLALRRPLPAPWQQQAQLRQLVLAATPALRRPALRLQQQAQEPAPAPAAAGAASAGVVTTYSDTGSGAAAATSWSATGVNTGAATAAAGASSPSCSPASFSPPSPGSRSRRLRLRPPRRRRRRGSSPPASTSISSPFGPIVVMVLSGCSPISCSTSNDAIGMTATVDATTVSVITTSSDFTSATTAR